MLHTFLQDKVCMLWMPSMNMSLVNMHQFVMWLLMGNNILLGNQYKLLTRPLSKSQAGSLLFLCHQYLGKSCLPHTLYNLQHWLLTMFQLSKGFLHLTYKFKKKFKKALFQNQKNCSLGDIPCPTYIYHIEDPNVNFYINVVYYEF